MRWLRRRKKMRTADPALETAQADTHERLEDARQRRDVEVRRMHEERTSVVEPLRDINKGNHLADLAVQALRHRRA